MSGVRAVQRGDIIGGRYVVQRTLGTGGVGLVVAARHVELRHLVAIKLLRSDLVQSEEAATRLLREARTLALLRTAHAPRILDVGTRGEGGPFVVMEYLDGQDLGTVLRSGPLSIADACEFVTQASEAIEEAHSLAIIHRDIKLSNLFVTRSVRGKPLIKVLDFGLAKWERECALTASGHIVGSPHYMSPEQMRSLRDADVRSDIWSLGVVLFALLTRQLPFDGEGLPGVCGAVLFAPAPAVTRLCPAVSPELEAVVQRCLRKAPEERFQSVAELATALAAASASSARGLGGCCPSTADCIAGGRTLELGPRASRATFDLSPDAEAASAAGPALGPSPSGSSWVRRGLAALAFASVTALALVRNHRAGSGCEQRNAAGSADPRSVATRHCGPSGAAGANPE
jgi:serine/threonine-protein kinase